jgi:hypothetical protein
VHEYLIPFACGFNAGVLVTVLFSVAMIHHLSKPLRLQNPARPKLIDVLRLWWHNLYGGHK